MDQENKKRKIVLTDDELDITVKKRDLDNSFFKEYEFVWAKLGGCKWWPAVTIKSTDCGYYGESKGVWVYWFRDHKISNVPKQKIANFVSCYKQMKSIPNGGKLRNEAIFEALQALADFNSYSWHSKDALFAWADHGFENLKDDNFTSLPKSITKYLEQIRMKIEISSTHEESNYENNIDASEMQVLEQLQLETLKIEDLCVSCRKNDATVISEHPLLKGGLCVSCQNRIEERAFALGNDGKNIFCVICSFPGSLVLCDNPDCLKSYCMRCLNFFLTPDVIRKIIETSPWYCFFCVSGDVSDSLLQVQTNWEEKLLSLYSHEKYSQSNLDISLTDYKQKTSITVLSLFDGISTAKLVLDMLGISINNYFSSEIDEAALNVSKFHYMDEITYLGDVRNITEKTIENIGQIDLVIGGSPCNDLSLVNPARKGLYDFRGTGNLFFDFFHVLSIVKRANPKVFYLFENVAAMQQKDKRVISTFLMHEPALIDAKYFSPQSRPRYFWGNIPGLHVIPNFWNSVTNDEIRNNILEDCILPNMGRKAVVEKINTITTQRNSLIQMQGHVMPVMMNGEPDVLWVTELEKVFGFPLHYTDTGNLNITKRRELLGRSWSVPVIKNILQPLRNFFKCCKNSN